MKKPKKIPKEFCSYCGRQLIYQGMKGSEHFGPYFTRINFYDTKTGKRKMRYLVSCPKRTAFWAINFKHDSHAFGEEVLV